jgi:hypothetical protein
MLVFQAAEPDKIPVSAEQGIRFVTMRLCAIVGVAMLITAGLLWFSGMRQSANFSAQSDETPMQVANGGAKIEVRPATKVEAPVAENDLAATSGKPAATVPSLPNPEVVPTGGTLTPIQVADGGQEVRSAENDLAATSGKPVPTAAPILPTPVVAPTGGTRAPMQVANGDGEVEVQPATNVEPPVADNDLAATIGKPVPTASSSLPTPVVAATSGTAKPTSESTLAPVGSSAVPQPALAFGSATQLDKTEIAMLVSRGKDFVRDRDLASARLLFQRAAAAGNAEATSILGTAPFLPVPKVASTGAPAKPTSESAVAPLASGPVSGPALASGGATQLDNNEVAMFVTRGKEFLKDGDLASARLLFQRAAAAGNAEAAFSLGTTFDPQFIGRMGVVGMEPDIARARQWYKRAAELGSVGASEQLATLSHGTRE